MVATSGSSSERVAVVTASARSLPALMYSTAGRLLNITCTWPAMRSLIAGHGPGRKRGMDQHDQMRARNPRDRRDVPDQIEVDLEERRIDRVGCADLEQR